MFFATSPVIMTGSCILILVARVAILTAADSWMRNGTLYFKTFSKNIFHTIKLHFR